MAAIDAVAWPALGAMAVATVSGSTGIVGWVLVGLGVVLLPLRVRRAVWQNERYWFTTWRLGAPLAALVAIGLAMKLLA